MFKLNRFIVAAGILVTAVCQGLQAQEVCPIIPQPQQVEKANGTFLLNVNTPVITANELLEPVANYLRQELLKTEHLALNQQSESKRPSVKLQLSPRKNADDYTLEIKPESITISAKDASGAFHGAVSLLQIARTAKNNKGVLNLPAWKIKDNPRYGWRGIMLDESRHFFGMEKVKSILDWMAFYKLNRFHWHLTDEPGWRIEIKKYPGLALIGGVGDFLNGTLPAQYYTQEQIKEIVAYAAQRFITVIPEIDMPGHATAANRAYPEFSGGGSTAHPEFTFNPGKEGTYHYLTDILRETNTLFPSSMIHLGGDEVSYGNQQWSSNPDINTLMQNKGIGNLKDVETYFMKRMADSVYNMNAKVLVWDEMAEAGLPADKTIIFWWRHDKPQMLKHSLDKGYNVVLCPRLPFYFDFVQDSLHNYGRKWNKLYNSLEDVYSFSLDKYLPESGKDNKVLGIQADLWSETLQNEARLDYLLFPRITALAEAAWSSEAHKDFQKFTERLKPHLLLFREASLYYYDPFAPEKNPEPVRIGAGIKRFNTEL